VSQPKSPFFEKLIDALEWVGYRAEHVFVLELEGVQRILRLLDPRLYIERLRVRKITEGHSRKATDKFAILVVYAKSSLPSFTTNFIAAIKASPFNLVIVSNQQLEPPFAEELRQNCRLLVERKNIGRDFGGYKDGISVVCNRFPNVDRLVIANDSVIYLNAGLAKLISDLDGDDNFIGVSEVFDHHYHVAAFLMSFGAGVIRSAAFRRFWRRYRPIGTRRWAIFRGEGALTAALLRAGFQPRILFKAEHLHPYLRIGTSREAGEIIAMMPIERRRRLTRRLGDLRGEAFADGVVHAIMIANQMHTGGLLFKKFLGLPIVKRDIVYREINAVDELPIIFDDVASPLKEEAMADLARRGTAASFGIFKKMLYRHSAA
jgi:hypothetical protein